MVHLIWIADSPGVSSFMDDVDRVVAKNYEPSDQDVIKARLRTVGVQEYRFGISGGKYSTFDANMTHRMTTC